MYEDAARQPGQESPCDIGNTEVNPYVHLAGEPGGDLCQECFEWRPYPPGQEHFGWAWWRTCEPGCAHAHHEAEVWIG